jgi:hypothetical protein
MTYAQAEEATAFICSVASCGEIATVLVEHAGTSERPLCPEHWHEACAAVPSVLTVSRILPRPLCLSETARAVQSRSFATSTRPFCRAANST